VPWFPDFVSAAELARRESRADPVEQYVTALDHGDPRDLETVWPGDVVVHDPRAGVVRGHRDLRAFVVANQAWLAERHTRIDRVAATSVPGRAVVELLAHLEHDGQRVSWPVAVVAECHEETSVEFRTYCSQWPVDGRRHLRPPILEAGEVRLGGVVGAYVVALAAGDVDGVVGTFAATGYLQEPVGRPDTHRGAEELRSFFSRWFGAGGGITQQGCAVTDDGERCAVEYNCVRWGSHEVPPQAGLAVYERTPDGPLAAVRVYDDIEIPAG
jgi:limonene-1,2-epoxide hydrolase